MNYLTVVLMESIRFAGVEEEVENILDEDFVEKYVDEFEGWNVYDVLETADILDIDEEDNCWVRPEIKARFKRGQGGAYILATLIKETCIDHDIKWDGLMDLFYRESKGFEDFIFTEGYV